MLKVGLVNIPHLLHCKSVDVDITFITFDYYVAHLRIKVLHLRGRISSRSNLNSSPQDTLTNLWRVVEANVTFWGSPTQREAHNMHVSIYLYLHGSQSALEAIVT